MNFKLALAAAAVVGLAGTAQAADLAKKAPAAADYVKVCDAYGAGFFYIPGSETCLKISGFVRAEVRTGDSSATAPAAWLDWSNRGSHAIMTRARAALQFDARTNTEMGLLRSYIEMWVTNDSASNGTNAVNLRNAYIQFAGLTAGRAMSNFDFIEGGYHYGIIEPDTPDHRVNQLAYTFAFGNGISATVAIEDKSTSDGISLRSATYGGEKYPDLVANLAVSQAWGRAQLMAALHDDYNVVALAGSDRKVGYALGAGVEVNLPMLGAGDKAFLQGFYTKGAVGYALNNLGQAAKLLNGAVVVGTNDFNTVGTSINQTTAWSISGGLNHNFSKQVEANLGASYASVDQTFAATAAGRAAGDYKTFIIGGDLRWKPVSGFHIGVGLDYQTIDYKAAGIANDSRWLATLRVQRNF